nr:DUF4838 domain-containing protein [uncultured Chitinophaga sp.]
MLGALQACAGNGGEHQRETKPPASDAKTPSPSGKGNADYVIIIPARATGDEQNAAKVLQRYLAQVTGGTYTITSDKSAAVNNEILIGKNNRLAKLNVTVPYGKLGEDGFLIKTVNNKLVLAGGPGKGNTYAAYTFLEKYLGCRKYTPDVTVIPRQSSLTLPQIANDVQVPTIKLRVQNFYPDKNDYYDWHKLNSVGRDNQEWGAWVYEFDQYLPPNTYFKSHPEYYSYREDQKKRITGGQLCLTNEDVYNIVVANLKQQIAAKPNARYWSLCQNDNMKYCQCTNCKKLDDQYNSHMGSLLSFVNRVAANFPDKIISTHAYTYSLKPPQGLKPASNVLIIASTINADRSFTIPGNPKGGDLRKYIAGWNALTDKFYIWDYVVQFSNFLSTFPNIRTLAPNMKFFAQNGVTGVFEQASGYVPADLSELKAYMLNKLLWNPNVNIDEVENEFLDNYYGKAAGKIKEYIRLSESALTNSGQELSIYGNPADAVNGYLSPDMLKRYLQLFNDAESLVANDQTLRDRVERARMSVGYAILKIYNPKNKARQVQALAKSAAPAAAARSASGNATIGTPPGIDVSRELSEFMSASKKNNIDLLSNYGGEYRISNLMRDYKGQ